MECLDVPSDCSFPNKAKNCFRYCITNVLLIWVLLIHFNCTIFKKYSGIDLNLGDGVHQKGLNTPYGHLLNKSIQEQLVSRSKVISRKSPAETFSTKSLKISPATSLKMPIKPAVSTASFPGLANFTGAAEPPSMIDRSMSGPFPVSNQFQVSSPDSGLPRKRGRPRKNPDEPRKKRGAIEYDPNGDSCTSILMEYKQSLIRRANQQRLEMLAPAWSGSHDQNSKNRPVNGTSSPSNESNGSRGSKNSKNSPNDKTKISTIIDRFHNFDPNSNISLKS